MKLEPTVFVVDDDPALQNSLRVLLKSVGLKVKTFSSAHQFLEEYDPDQPGCLITDVRMPGMGGLELQRELQDRSIPLPIIVMSGHGDVPMAVRAMKAGAADFVEKPLNDQELIDRIQKALAQDAYNRPIMEERAQMREKAKRLSAREREVMDWIVQGLPNKAIASELGLSEKTIETHRANLMRKLEVNSVAELVYLALRL